MKDRLENKLRALVCTGQISLGEAQQAISGDWATADAKYAGVAVSYPTQAPAPVDTRPPAPVYTQPAPVYTQPAPAPAGKLVHRAPSAPPKGLPE